MHAKYPNIFRPITLGPVEVPNRFYYSPHATPQTTLTGGPTQDYNRYILARAEGGCGLIILSMSAFERSRFVQPSAQPRANIEGWAGLADAVHEAGAKLFGELWYWWGAAGPWSPFSTPAPSMGASAVPYGLFENRTTTREMSKADIASMVDVSAGRGEDAEHGR